MIETEAEFATWVIAVARCHGFRVAHIRPARTEKGWRTPVQADGVGLPDLLMVNRKRGLGVALELKSERGRVSPEQADWILAFASTGWIAMVATPKDRDKLLAIFAGDRAA